MQCRSTTFFSIQTPFFKVKENGVALSMILTPFDKKKKILIYLFFKSHLTFGKTWVLPLLGITSASKVSLVKAATWKKKHLRSKQAKNLINEWLFSKTSGTAAFILQFFLLNIFFQHKHSDKQQKIKTGNLPVNFVKQNNLKIGWILTSLGVSLCKCTILRIYGIRQFCYRINFE